MIEGKQNIDPELLNSFLARINMELVLNEPYDLRQIDLKAFSANGEIFDGSSALVRQRFISNGLIDNCVLTLSRETLACLGLGIASMILGNETSFSVRLGLMNEGYELLFRVSGKEEPNSNPELFSWIPEDLDVFLSRISNKHSFRPKIYLPFVKPDYPSIEEMDKRRTIVVEGDYFALAECSNLFLNLAFSSPITNYITVHHLDVITSFLSEESCELRIELLRS